MSPLIERLFCVSPGDRVVGKLDSTCHHGMARSNECITILSYKCGSKELQVIRGVQSI